jgi:hypothetical protein
MPIAHAISITFTKFARLAAPAARERHSTLAIALPRDARRDEVHSSAARKYRRADLKLTQSTTLPFVVV